MNEKLINPETSSIDLKNIQIPGDIIARVPVKYAVHYKIIPVGFESDTITIATTDPLDFHLADDLKLLLKYKIHTVLAREEELGDAIRNYYGVGADTLDKLETPKNTEHEDASSSLDIEATSQDPTIVRFVNQILAEAFRDKATDIHLEPFEDEFRIRYRIDGVLTEVKCPAEIKKFQAAIISRIKIMAKLNIADQRLPQDGRIKVRIGGLDLDMRVSTFPTPFGESLVIRLLSSATILSLGKLGLSPRDQKILEKEIRRPHGIIFVTGPTGSGKSTTLAAALSQINTPERKIITLEDPIEYQMRGITQVQVHPQIGLTFAQGLKSSLRHDPDIMMVGEVRDFETAEIAIRQALTGHLVFSTLHTNDAPSTVTRLIDMGVEPFLISSSLKCMIAQRLVRKICEDCKTRVPGKDYYQGRGCAECRNTGYKGRTAIYELLPVSGQIQRLIVEKASHCALREKALQEGMRSLRDDGWDKVSQGITTREEVLRVTLEE